MPGDRFPFRFAAVHKSETEARLHAVRDALLHFYQHRKRKKVSRI
jgi:hypothetical protein